MSLPSSSESNEPLYQIGWSDGQEGGRFGKPRTQAETEKIMEKFKTENSDLQFFLVKATPS